MSERFRPITPDTYHASFQDQRVVAQIGERPVYLVAGGAEHIFSGTRWEQVLAADPDHEKHLETSEGRTEAVLNVLKNGGMTLEVMVMGRNWKNYRVINHNVNEVSGRAVLQPRTTWDHLTRTVSRVGAAARSDVDEKDWQLTLFGQECQPVLIYLWQTILHHNINPVTAIGSQSSMTNTNEHGVTSSPKTRNMILRLIGQGETVIARLSDKAGIDRMTVKLHLDNLQKAGFIIYESVNPTYGDAFSLFSLTPEGGTQTSWPVYSQGRNRISLSRAVEETIIDRVTELVAEGQEEFTTQDITEKAGKKSESVGHQRTVSSVLNFFVQQGLLEKGGFGNLHQSLVSLTPEGRVFLDEILEVIDSWSKDPNSIEEINRIRATLSKNPQEFALLYREIAGVYERTSPMKNTDLEGKTLQILSLIAETDGGLTRAEVLRRVGVMASGSIKKTITNLIDSGELQVKQGEGGQKYLFVPK